MSKKDIQKNIENFEKRIREHEAAIRKDPTARDVNHHQKEIRNFREDIEKLRSKLTSGAYEQECFKCKKMIYPRMGKCPKCETYLG